MGERWWGALSPTRCGGFKTTMNFKFNLKGNGTMKVTTVLATFAMVASLNAAVIEQVIVRQQWPWSTDVKVEYKLSGVTSPVDISVKAFNGNVELDSSRLASAMTGDRFGIAEDGVGTIIIDPVKAFGTSKVALANFKVKLSVSESAENMNEVLYKIFDLESGGCDELTRADFYNGKAGTFVTNFADIGNSAYYPTRPFATSLDDVLIWTDVTNKLAYKTTKLVMRKIPAKGKSFYMGAGGITNEEVSIDTNYTLADEDRFRIKVTFTNDFWLGVFEVTRKQYALLTGGDEVSDSEAALPIYHLDYSKLRGVPIDWSNWPADIYAVSPSSEMFKIRQHQHLAGITFDLPTEAQWEYACRAGTDTQLYEGIRFTGTSQHIIDIASLGWYSRYTSDSKEVGSLRPNAFGLYDMLGNAAEYCRDILNPEWSLNSGYASMSGECVEPMGWDNFDDAALLDEDCKTICRGGSYLRDYTYVHSACRREQVKLNETKSRWTALGFRLMIPSDRLTAGNN